MPRVHGICVEKNYQLPKGSHRRKFKGRGVLLGSKLKNQHWQAAFFQGFGSFPAMFEVSRRADFYGCIPRKWGEAIQAYIEAKLTRPPCWVARPEDAWPDDMDIRKYRRPVARLVKAFNGHLDAGTMWEQHCDKHVLQVGLMPVGKEWRSAHLNKELQMLLVIYVDDLKLSLPEQNFTKGWDMLRSKLKIATTWKDSSNSVERCLDLVGKGIKLKHVSTPSLPEETKNHQSRAPAPGNQPKTVNCPWCSCEFDPGSSVTLQSDTSATRQEGVEVQRGALALMQLAS